jgi:hypothetical protein
MGKARPIKIKRTKTKGYRIYFEDGTLFTDNSFKSEEEALSWLSAINSMRRNPNGKN